MKNNKLSALKYLVILGAALWSLPVLADETNSSTPDIVTSTPEVVTSTPSPEPEAAASSTLTLRFEDQIIWTGKIELTSTLYHDETNNLDYLLNTNTVFSSLVLADQQSNAFNISDAQYNAGFDSFYLACINVSSTSTNNACYNWNYVVNNNYPSVGVDKYLLNGGENIYVYFSNPWKITATTSTFPLDTTTTLQTWRYQFDNLSEPWVLDPDHLVDISIPNPTPTGWWDQTITVTTTQTNSSGTVDYKFSATGTYYAKIVSLDWTKWSNPITLNVQGVNTTTQTNTTTNEPPPTTGGSGSAPAISTTEINNAVQKILNFLKSKQLNDGSILDLQMSDWSAMSFGANGTYAESIRTSTFSLYDYLNITFVTSTTQTLNNCTEYARHILGLLSSGFSKTNTQIIDLKNKIKTECLAEGQVGQAGINDDIFILLALLATDESTASEIIQVSVNAIKNDQQPSGAFTWDGWAGQDVTGAAINALKYASTFGIVVDDLIFQNAKTYLQNTQLSDGGWGFSTSSDPLTTSWAMHGINALGEGQVQWTNSSNKNPWTALINKLGNTDYYTSPGSTDGIDWFATKHAVPALLGKSWPIILTPITQPSSGGSGGSSNTPISTSTEIASIITTTTTSTTAITTPTSTVQTTTTTNENETGQILGMRIESEEPQTKIAGQKIVKSKVAIKIETKPTTTLSEDNNQNINEQTEVNQENNNTSSPAREMIKKLLILCILGAGIIAVYLGFKSIKK